MKNHWSAVCQQYIYETADGNEKLANINITKQPKLYTHTFAHSCSIKEVYLPTDLFQLDKKQEDLFPTGTKNQEPSVAKMSDDMFLLGKDTQSVLTNLKGEAVSKLAVKWSEIPVQLGMT